MLKAILFFLLFIVLTTAFLYFIFIILYSSLKSQNVNVTKPLLSSEDLKCKKEFKITGFDLLNSKKVVIRDEKIVESLPNYYGLKDCNLFNKTYESKDSFLYGCLGFGNCIRVCPINAIQINNGKAKVSTTCNGCGKCISACPQNLIYISGEDVFNISDKNVNKNSFKIFKKYCKLIFRKK